MSRWARKTTAEMANCSRIGARNVGRPAKLHCAGRGAASLPALPVGDLLLQDRIERLHQARNRQGRCRFGAAAKAERQNRAPRQFAGQGHIARAGDRVFPGHRTMSGKILPAVAGADIAGAGPAEGVALILVGGGECEPERALLGPQHAPAMVAFGDRAHCRSRWRRGAAPATRRAAARPRRRALHSISRTSRRGSGVRRRLKDIARVLVADFDRRHARRRQAEPVVRRCA